MVSVLALVSSRPLVVLVVGCLGGPQKNIIHLSPSTGQQPSFSCEETLSQQRTSLKEGTVLRWEWSLLAKQRRHTERPELVYKKEAETF